MNGRQVPFPLSNEQLHREMCAAVRASLRPLTATMAGIFLFLSSAALVMGFGSLALPLCALELTSAALMGGFYLVATRFRIADRYVHPFLVAVAMVALARSAAQLYFFGAPRDTTNFGVLVAAVGFLSLSLFWSALIVGCSWACWLGIAWCLHADSEWVHYGFFLLWATALGGVVQLVRMRLMRRLLRAEAGHRELVEHLPAISYLDDVGAGGRPLYISPQVQRVLGYSPADWCRGHDFWKQCIYVADRERVLQAARENIRLGIGHELEYRLVTGDGRVVWVHDHSTQIVVGDGKRPLMFGTIVDVTERKRTELLRAGANSVFEKLTTGAGTDETLEVLLAAAEEAHPGIVTAIVTCEGGRWRSLSTRNLTDATRQAVDRISTNTPAGDLAAALMRRERAVIPQPALDEQGSRAGQDVTPIVPRACWVEPIPAGDGAAYALLAYYRPSYTPRPEDGELFTTVAHLAGLTVDRARTAADLNTYREHLEDLVAERGRQLAASLEQLRHSERLASIGTLAAGIAHEINNPVGMMLLSAEQALHRVSVVDDAGPVSTLLREIVSNAKRCGQIVKGILRFSRQQPAELLPGDVNAVVEQAVRLTRPYAQRHGGAIEMHLAPSLPPAFLNHVELEQVFVNLIRNGIESSDESPHVAISTARSSGRVRITVQDNGRGVPKEDLGRIFDPFYTTRQSDGGTGLGLSLAYGIVTDHGGTIRVDEAAGGGTCMTVDLPAADGVSEALRPGEDAAAQLRAPTAVQ